MTADSNLLTSPGGFGSALESSNMPADQDGLAVAICSRNRIDDLVECVRSVLANESAFELIVVDQSDVPAALDTLPEFAHDGRLRYITSKSRGLSRARNEAMQATRAELLAFTDDDCRVPVNWVQGIRGLFASEPDIALAYGRVVVPEELWKIGFTASFEPQDEIRYRGRLPEPLEPWGIGANMAMRRQLALDSGGFDAFLGAGTPLHGGEELDLAMRVLGDGHTVACTNAFELTHLGVRPHAIARVQYRNYALGAGAAYAKNMRLRTPGARGFFLRTLALQFKVALSAVLSGKRPHGLGMSFAMLSGAARAFGLKLDPRSRNFRSSASGIDQRH